jgi:dTDP-4-amino-4,6-dideoxygalactose transaminase
MAQMRARGVGTQVHYIPIHLHPYYRQRYGFKPDNFPRAEEFYGQALSLPMYPKMDDRDVAHVIETVEAVVPR